MGNINELRSKQLGMSWGKANNKLRKSILFNLLIKYNENICFKCSNRIEKIEELSIEHKIAWFRNDTKLFWDLDNIAFSHLSCNSSQPRTIEQKKNLSILMSDEKNPRCKISIKQVEEIKSKKDKGFSIIEIANEYNLSREGIYYILKSR